MNKKVAVVTGGASGIGKSIARSLLDDDYQVIIADKNASIGQPISTELSCEFLQVDLGNALECGQLMDRVTKITEGVSVLVNNAGFQHVAPLQDFPIDKWNEMIQVMLTAPFVLTKGVWPLMQKAHWGRIINIGSIHSQVASLHKAAYTSAKHGLIGLTKTAALEGGPYGITCNAICPAYVKTPLVDDQIDAQAKNLGIEKESVIQDVMLKNAAVKRLIDPSEVGEMVRYL